MRRQLILISKVISNISTNVKFGDKESYMTILNDFLEEKEHSLDKYYDFLITVFLFLLIILGIWGRFKEDYYSR